ncbi:MAG: hypothetical protein AAFX55_03995 [Bacteroidota bacterium]
MDIIEFENIEDYKLSVETDKLMDNLLMLFRKAEYAEVKQLVKQFVEKATDIEILSLARTYVDCLNYEWPQEIKRLALEEYHIIELICETHGPKTCEFLDFILFENDNHILDIRHLHSGAVHLLVILALRNIRKNETIEKLSSHGDHIFYIYGRTQEMINALQNGN